MTWVCAVCTYSENVDARTICELCGSERPGRLSSGSKQSSNQEVQGSDIDEAILVSMGFPIESVKNALALHVRYTVFLNDQLELSLK